MDSFHSLSIEQVFKELKTSKQGLSLDEVRKRKSLFGRNVIEEEKVSKIRILIRQFNSILVYILIAASILSLAIGEWADFAVINIIIFINGMIGFWQELKSETAIAALKKLTESRNKVLRNGSLCLVQSSELVPGDYVLLHEGEIVTADIRLVDSAGLMVDESTITGESTPVSKDHAEVLPGEAMPYELTNMLLTGTTVVRGMGQGIVVLTGSRTYLATIANKAQEASPETPLTKALNFFAKRYIALLIILFSFLGFIGHLQGRGLLDLAYILLASLVSAVPEGLPIVVTLVMVIGAISLSKKQALIRHLPSVETLGSATVVASDKTGTITEGKLIVKEVFSKDEKKLRHVAALCNDSIGGVGDPLDVALSDWVDDYEQIRNEFPRKWAYSFDTRLMLMATVNQIDGKEELLIKGAYEALSERVENKDALKEMDAIFQSYVQQGLRVLAFGVGDWKSQDPRDWKIQIVGLIGFFDPPKQGVKEAVAFAKKAGIRVLMITGDHPLTAKMIAHEVGIWTESSPILTGKEIENLSDEDLLKQIKQATVFARSLPEHKYRIVKLLQECGEIVAVTGDGVNDVPALKMADIGIGMGGGTEAAKSASKMIITDNNLGIIVDAIRNARVIADNIRKVIYYLTSTSLQEICLISLAITMSLPLPLTAIQILWINIVTDGVQDKTFAFSKAEGDVMNRKPRSPAKQFFDLSQVIRILVFGGTLGLICFFLYYYLLGKYALPTVSTIIFTSVVMAQWANGIQAQKENEPFLRNIKRSFEVNPLIFWAVCAGILLQCFAIYIAPAIFHVTSLSFEHWKYPLVVFFAAFGIVEARKWIEFSIKKRLS